MWAAERGTTRGRPTCWRDFILLRQQPLEPVTPECSTEPVPELRRARFDDLCGRLRGGDRDAVNAAHALWRFGAPAVEPLVAAVETGPETARCAAAESLGRIGDPRAAVVLEQALQPCSEPRQVHFRKIATLALLSVGALSWVTGFACGIAEAHLAARITFALGAVLLTVAGFVQPRPGRIGRATLGALARLAARHASVPVATRLQAAAESKRKAFWQRESLRDLVATAVREIRSATSGAPDPEIAWRRDFDAVRERLHSSDPNLRVCAVYALAGFGEEAVEPLQAALEHADSHVCVAAVEVIRDRADRDWVPELLLALRDEEPSVHLAAAEALGKVGDERAVAPLTDALRYTFPRRSARTQRAAGILLLVIIAVQVAWVWIGGIRITSLFPMLPCINILISFISERRTAGAMVRVVAESLACVAEDCPTPSLRSALSDLRIVAADPIQQRAPTRRACREAAARIQELTERIEALPVPVDREQEAPRVLPVPVEGAVPIVAALPRVAD